MYFSKLTLIIFSIFILTLGIIPLYKKRLYKKIMILQILIYTLFYGLRDKRVGIDTVNYIGEYNLGTGGYFELGFQKLGYFLYKLNFSPTQYLSTIILIQLIFIYMGIINFRIRNSYKGIIMWGMMTNTIVVFNSINGLRQGIAASILFYVVSIPQKFFFKKNIIKTLSYIVHKSSILFILLGFWKKIQIKKIKKYRQYTLIFILILILGILLKNFFIKLGMFSEKYVTFGSKIVGVKIIQTLGIFTLLFLTIKNEKKKYLKSDLFNIINYYSFLLIVILNFYSVNEVSNRYTYYTGYFSFIIIIYFINIYKNRLFLLKILIILNCFYYLILLNTNAYSLMFKLAL